MAKPQHIGTAGQLAVMSELCFRGYNVAMPEIDIGDDIFVVTDIFKRNRLRISSGYVRMRYLWHRRRSYISFL